MQIMDTKTVVIDFFKQNSTAGLPTDESGLLHCAYLDMKLIDSMGIILMITEFEEKLGVSFTAEDMQSYNFQTIGGLIDIIENKRRGN
jgi:acyl carrier protein